MENYGFIDYNEGEWRHATTSIKKGLKTMVDRSYKPSTTNCAQNTTDNNGETAAFVDVKTDDNGSPREQKTNNEQEWKPTTQPTIATAWGRIEWTILLLLQRGSIEPTKQKKLMEFRNDGYYGRHGGEGKIRCRHSTRACAAVETTATYTSRLIFVIALCTRAGTTET